MSATLIASDDIAIMKAKTAAMDRRTTRVFIGAVGVSGVTGDQDEPCAKAGLGG